MSEYQNNPEIQSFNGKLLLAPDLLTYIKEELVPEVNRRRYDFTKFVWHAYKLAELNQDEAALETLAQNLNTLEMQLMEREPILLGDFEGPYEEDFGDIHSGVSLSDGSVKPQELGLVFVNAIDPWKNKMIITGFADSLRGGTFIDEGDFAKDDILFYGFVADYTKGEQPVNVFYELHGGDDNRGLLETLAQELIDSNRE